MECPQPRGHLLFSGVREEAALLAPMAWAGGRAYGGREGEA